MSWKNVFFVLHGPESARVISEFTRIVISGYDMDNFVLTRVQGGATNGIEQASKECYKAQKNFIVLRDLDDLKELIQFDALYLFPPPAYASIELDIPVIAQDIADGKKIAFVFGGGKVSGLTRKEFGAGETVKVLAKDIGPLGTVAVLINELSKIVPI
jgi:SpoU rRNA methylase family enzyme